jgi:hypothetical protein
LVIWWLCIQVAANVPVLCFSNPARPGKTWADHPGSRKFYASGYCAPMNPRAQANHEARATLEAVKSRAKRLGKVQLRTAQKIDDLEETYRLKFEHGEHTALPEWYLRSRARQIRSMRFAERNPHAEGFCELDRRRITLEIEALKVEAATSKVQIRFVFHLIAKFTAWAKSHAVGFARPEAPPEPIPLEEHPTAAPNSPNIFN